MVDPSKNCESSKSPGSKWASPVSYRELFPWKFENGRRERENNSSPFWAASALVFRQLHFWLPFVSRDGVRCFWQHFTSPTLALSRQWATAPIYVNESLPTPPVADHPPRPSDRNPNSLLHPSSLSLSLASFDRVKGPRGYGHRRFESVLPFGRCFDACSWIYISSFKVINNGQWRDELSIHAWIRYELLILVILKEVLGNLERPFFDRITNFAWRDIERWQTRSDPFVSGIVTSHSRIGRLSAVGRFLFRYNLKLAAYHRRC